MIQTTDLKKGVSIELEDKAYINTCMVSKVI